MSAAITLTVGKRATLQVADLAAASREYCRLRDESGEGASTFPTGRLSGGFYVSYNGRVWRGTPRAWTAGDVPAYDNRTPVLQ